MVPLPDLPVAGVAGRGVPAQMGAAQEQAIPVDGAVSPSSQVAGNLRMMPFTCPP